MDKEKKLVTLRKQLGIEIDTWQDHVLLDWIEKEGIKKVSEEVLEMIEEVKKTAKKIK